MPRRRKKRNTGFAEVPLSPLIDCVFLMLIFFLVTSMIKRWERQIPTRMQPDAMTLERGEESRELELGLDEEGNLYKVRGRSKHSLKTERVGAPAPYLRRLAGEVPLETPITVIAEEQTDFQTFIDVLDEFEIQGFTRVRVRASDVYMDGQAARTPPAPGQVSP
ncbi:MAG: biopolymer transporter ExbD [Kiritimatiellia bacterium]